MKIFTFHITGGSPYDGELIIIAKTIKVAQRMADEYIEAYNNNTRYCRLSITNWDCDSFTSPCIVHFDSGEA